MKVTRMNHSQSRLFRLDLQKKADASNAADAVWYDAKRAADKANYASHRFGRIDDCIRCLNCEIGIWNGHKENCNA